MLLLAACGGDSQPAFFWSGEVVETPQGLVVRNPAHPLDTLHLEHLWSRDSEEWGDLSGIRIAGQHVLALDRLTTSIHVFQASDGSSVSSFGRQGQGPGELGRIHSAALVGGRVFVSHSGDLALSVYSLDGEYLETVEWGWPVGDLNSWGDSALVGFRLGGGGGVVGKKLGTSGEPAPIGPEFLSPYPPEEYGTCIRATAKEGWIARVLCSAPRIQVAGPEAPSLFWIEVPIDPSESSESELDQYIDRFYAMQGGGRPMNSVIRSQLAGVRERARVRPALSAVRIDPRGGRILVVEQPFGDQSWGPAVLHVFLLNGVYLGALETGLHIKDLDMAGDRLVILSRHPETDETTIHAYSLRGDPEVEERARSFPALRDLPCGSRRIRANGAMTAIRVRTLLGITGAGLLFDRTFDLSVPPEQGRRERSECAARPLLSVVQITRCRITPHP